MKRISISISPRLALPRAVVVALSVISLCLPSLVVRAEIQVATRSVYIGVPGTSWENLIGDFDGDGLDEIIVSAERQTTQHPIEQGETVAIAGPLDGDGWGLRSLFHLAGRAQGVPHILHREGGDAVGIVVEVFIPGRGYVTRLEVLSGIPLAPERSFDLFPGSRLAAIGDIDGDGEFEWLEWGASQTPPHPRQVRVRNLATGELEWSREISGSIGGVAATSLDADPALEIVITGATGTIMDGATGALEWEYAGGFALPILAGNFDANPATKEFSSSSLGRVVVFGVQPYTPLADYSTGGFFTQAAAGDLNSDGIDEIVLGSVVDTRILDLSNGSVRVLGNGVYGDDFVSIGDVDAREGNEVVLSGWGAGRNWSVTVRDPASWAVLRRVQAVPAGPMRVAIAEIDPSPGVELLAAVPSAQPYGDALEIRSLETGRLLRSVTFPSLASVETSGRSLDIVVAQWDGDEALEIGLVMETNQGSEFRVIDAASLETQVQFFLRDQNGTDIYPTKLNVADIDNDGTLELVTVSLEGNNAFRAHIFDAQNGAQKWRSTLLQTGSRPTLAIRQMDSDAASEILVWSGTVLFVYDGATRVLEASRILSSVAASLFVSSPESDCRLGTFDAQSQIREFGCVNLNPVLGPQLAGAVRWVEFVDQLDGFIAAVDDQVALVSADGSSRQTLADGLGWRPGQFQTGLASHGSACGSTVVVANDGEIRWIDLLPTEVFADGFELAGLGRAGSGSDLAHCVNR